MCGAFTSPQFRVSCLQLASGLPREVNSGQWGLVGNNSLAEGCVQSIRNWIFLS